MLITRRRTAGSRRLLSLRAQLEFQSLKPFKYPVQLLFPSELFGIALVPLLKESLRDYGSVLLRATAKRDREWNWRSLSSALKNRFVKSSNLKRLGGLLFVGICVDV